MNDNNGHKQTDDLSFGFSDTDGWLGGTGVYAPKTVSADDSLRKSVEANDSATRRAGYSSAAYRHDLTGTDYKNVAVVRKKPAPEPADPNALVFFIAWLVIGVAVSLFCCKVNEFWEILLFLMQAIAGISVFCGSLQNNRMKHFARFLAIDLGVIALFVIMRFVMPGAFHTLSYRGLPVALIFVIFGSFGVFMLVYSMTTTMHRRQRCTVKVQGMCLEVMCECSHGNRGSAAYCPIFEYIYNGEKYIVRPETFTNISPPEVNSVSDLLINPDKPEEFFDIRREGRESRVLSIIGGAWGGVCALFIVSFILSAFIVP